MNVLFFRNISLLMFFLSLFIVSCDEDVVTVGADALVGSSLDVVQTSDFTVSLEQIDVDKPQSNNLEFNLLGSNVQGAIDANGVETYDILSQFNSATVSYTDSYELSDDGLSSTEVNYELKSAQLVIPYEYTLSSSETDYDTFSVASAIGANSLTCNVYKSEYQLQTVDFNNSTVTTTQNYYADGSDGEVFFNEALIKSALYAEDFTVTLPSESESFDVYYSDDDGEVYGEEELSLQFEAIRIDLNQNFIDDINSIIVSDSSSDLDGDGQGGDLSLEALSDDSIYNLFKGIYIEAISESDSGLVEVNGNNNFYVTPGIQLLFEKTTIEKTFVSGELVSNENSIDQASYYSTFELSSNPINIISKDDFENTDEGRVVLKSGRGSIGKLDLFSEDELNEMFVDNVLINQAIIELTVDQSFYDENDAFDIENLPTNIFMADLESGAVLSDFSLNYVSDNDFSEIQSNHLYALKEVDGEYVYQVNVTNHITDILNSNNSSDLTDANVSLSISVTDDLGLTGFSELYNSVSLQYLNQGSLLSSGVVPFYGSNHEDETKRPKLTITYTESKN